MKFKNIVFMSPKSYSKISIIKPLLKKRWKIKRLKVNVDNMCPDTMIYLFNKSGKMIKISLFK